MTPLITKQPCDRCDDLKTIYDVPPFDICMASPTSDFECPKVFAAEEIADHAHTCAAAYAVMRHTPVKVRRDMAESDAGKYEEAAQAIGAEFDSAAFLSECGLHRVAA
jgi:hypothetical protein